MLFQFIIGCLAFASLHNDPQLNKFSEVQISGRLGAISKSGIILVGNKTLLFDKIDQLLMIILQGCFARLGFLIFLTGFISQCFHGVFLRRQRFYGIEPKPLDTID